MAEWPSLGSRGERAAVGCGPPKDRNLDAVTAGVASPSPRRLPSARTVPPAGGWPARASPLPTSGSIHIRRSARGQPPSGSAGSAREYGVQWWVGGHWRTYWCGPGRSRPEERWIDPYLAGPDGKPVHGTERVNVWDR
jgi:hypothetical protein